MSARVAVNNPIVTTRLYVESCCVCGVTYGFDENYERARRNDHKGWRCPNGHVLSFSDKSEAEEARDEADRVKRQLTNERAYSDRLRAEAQHQRRRAAAFKGQVTKARKRVGKGVCPCCNRSFPQLAAHMESQHPEYADGAS